MTNLDQAVVVKTFSNEMYARMASLHLQALGVEAVIRKDNCGGAYPQLELTGGVDLLVEPNDKERAEAILDEVEEKPSEENIPVAFPFSPTRFTFFSGFVLGLVLASFLFMVFGNSL